MSTQSEAGAERVVVFESCGHRLCIDAAAVELVTPAGDLSAEGDAGHESGWVMHGGRATPAFRLEPLFGEEGGAAGTGFVLIMKVPEPWGILVGAMPRALTMGGAMVPAPDLGAAGVASEVLGRALVGVFMDTGSPQADPLLLLDPGRLYGMLRGRASAGVPGMPGIGGTPGLEGATTAPDQPSVFIFTPAGMPGTRERTEFCVSAKQVIAVARPLPVSEAGGSAGGPPGEVEWEGERVPVLDLPGAMLGVPASLDDAQRFLIVRSSTTKRSACIPITGGSRVVSLPMESAPLEQGELDWDFYAGCLGAARGAFSTPQGGLFVLDLDRVLG